MPTLRPSNPRELLRLIFCSKTSAAAAAIGFCVLRPPERSVERRLINPAHCGRFAHPNPGEAANYNALPAFLPRARADFSRSCRGLSAPAAYCSLISTSTPAGRSSFISASTVLSVGSTMSIRRWWVRISNWSRERLVDVRRAQDVEALHARRQGHRALDDGAGALGGVDDLGGGLVDQLVIERLEADADFLLGGHSVDYSRIFATTPEPTVLPPSRMAKRRPSSMAMGAISLTVIDTLSPGMTISLSLGSSMAPVTSVVRK